MICFTYDNLDRATAVIGSDGSGTGSLAGPETDYAYSAVTNPVHTVTVTGPTTDGTGATRPVTTSSYDAVGNLKQVVDPMGRTTAYVYGNLDRTTVNDRAKLALPHSW